MESAAELVKLIDSIVDTSVPEADFDVRGTSRCEDIEALIPRFGWDLVQDELFNLLRDDNREQEHWEIVARVFWGAVLDDYPLDMGPAIALLHHRRVEDNLAWSIASKLKGVGYLSDWNPLEEAEVKREMARLKRNVRHNGPSD